MATSGIITDQTRKIPVGNGPANSPFRFRYGLDRSADSIRGNQTGQDCLSVKWNLDRMAVVLCDGVSQSFFGDLSANFLCKSLSEYLLNLPLKGGLEQIQDQLIEFLNALSSDFSQIIENHRIDPLLPKFLQNVLETKRHLGSEAVFSGLLLDKKRSVTLVFWAGDSRIRVWKNQNEVTSTIFRQRDFKTLERWSSHKGLIGELHIKLLKPNQFDELILYSDGLSLADKEENLYKFDNVQIEKIVGQTKKMPGSDDTVFFQLTSRLQPVWEGGGKTFANKFFFEEDNRRLNVGWSGTNPQNTCELILISDTTGASYTTERNQITIPLDDIPQSGVFFTVREKSKYHVSPWSEWFFYKPRVVRSSLPIQDYRSEVVKKTTAYNPPITNQESHSGYIRQTSSTSNLNFPPRTVRDIPVKSDNRRWAFILGAFITFTLGISVLLITNSNNRIDHVQVPSQTSSIAALVPQIRVETSVPPTMPPTEIPTVSPTALPTENPTVPSTEPSAETPVGTVTDTILPTSPETATPEPSQNGSPTSSQTAATPQNTIPNDQIPSPITLGKIPKNNLLFCERIQFYILNNQLPLQFLRYFHQVEQPCLFQK